MINGKRRRRNPLTPFEKWGIIKRNPLTPFETRRNCKEKEKPISSFEKG
jgi:hypothetical protein